MTADNGRFGNFLDHLSGDTFTISLQLDPPSSVNTDKFGKVLDAVRQHRSVHAVDINSPSRRPAQYPITMASVACAHGRIGIPHLTCRDASFGGIVNQVLAAVAYNGLENVLVVTGDRSKDGLQTCGSDVFQGDAIGLVQALNNLRHGKYTKEPRVRFAIGVAFDYAAEDLERERDRLRQKREASANFVMSQPIFTLAQAHALLEAAQGVWDRPIMPGIWPLVNREQAEMLNANLPGITIPQEVIDAILPKSDGAAAARGREIARDLLRAIKEQQLFPGAYVIAPNRDPWSTLKMLNGD